MFQEINKKKGVDDRIRGITADITNKINLKILEILDIRDHDLDLIQHWHSSDHLLLRGLRVNEGITDRDHHRFDLILRNGPKRGRIRLLKQK